MGPACRELFSLSSDCPLKSDGQKNIYLISSMAAGDLSLLVTVKHPGGGERNGNALPSSRPAVLAIHHPLTRHSGFGTRTHASLSSSLLFQATCKCVSSPSHPPGSRVRPVRASHMCATESARTTRKGGGNMRSLPHILPRRPLCGKRRCVSRQGEPVWMCV